MVRGEAMASISEYRAGGVVIRHNNGVVEYLMVTSNANKKRWIIPAGHVEAGETDEETALREVYEEAGVQTTVLTDLGKLEYHWDRGEGQLHIETHLFLLKYVQTVFLEPEGRQVKFFTMEQLLTLNIWEESRRFLVKTADRIQELLNNTDV